LATRLGVFLLEGIAKLNGAVIREKSDESLRRVDVRNDGPPLPLADRLLADFELIRKVSLGPAGPDPCRPKRARDF
jgi:hypothetical protein